MSVINIIRQTSAIHVITDGLAIDEQGKQSNVSKVVPLPSLNAALAVNGHGLAPHFFAGAINLRCQSRIDLELEAADAVREIVDSLPFLAEDGFKLVVAGWDEDGKFNYGMSTGVEFGRPWKMTKLPCDNTISPMPFEKEWLPEFRKFVAPKTNPDKMNVDDVAVELVKLQRRLLPDGHRCIGGLVSRVTITKSGMRTRIVKRFPEHITSNRIEA
jgi:hypothetical protein